MLHKITALLMLILPLTAFGGDFPRNVNPNQIFIYLETQEFVYFENNKFTLSGPISSGKAGHRTTVGNFIVQYKEKNKRSKKYDNAPMPYSLHFYKGLFIHQGKLPGYPASHGCIRLNMADAKFLFSSMQPGDEVNIVSHGRYNIK